MLAIAPLSDALIGVQTAFSTVGALESTIGVAATAAGTVTTAAGTAANIGQTIGSTIWNNLQGLLRFVKSQATAVKQAMFMQANQYKMTATHALMNAKNSIKQEAKNLYREGITLSKLNKTMRFIFKILKKLWPIFKWIWILTKLMNELGVWMVRTIEVIIYRIFHIKDCFLWYMLEIIGFILYVPFEFFIWLFCMKESEKSFWKLVDSLDCMFNDMTGFHIFHYSDTILKKCYAVKLPPFPYSALPFEGDGEFTQEAFLRFIIDWFMPPSPTEIAQAVKTAGQLAKESAPIMKDAAGIVAEEIGDIFKMKKPDPKEAASVAA